MDDHVVSVGVIGVDVGPARESARGNERVQICFPIGNTLEAVEQSFRVAGPDVPTDIVDGAETGDLFGGDENARTHGLRTWIHGRLCLRRHLTQP